MAEWIDGALTTAKPTQFRHCVSEFWHHVKCERRAQKLPLLAITIFSSAVNTATCERLFSELGAIHSPTRNRMNPDKVRQIHAVRKGVRDKNGVAAGSNPVCKIVVPTERPRVSTPQKTRPRGDTRTAFPAQDEPLSARDMLDLETTTDAEVYSSPSETLEFWDELLVEIFEDEDMLASFHRSPSTSVTFSRYQPHSVVHFLRAMIAPFPKKN